MKYGTAKCEYFQKYKKHAKLFFLLEILINLIFDTFKFQAQNFREVQIFCTLYLEYSEIKLYSK